MFVHPTDDSLVSRMASETICDRWVLINLFRVGPGKLVGYYRLHFGGSNHGEFEFFPLQERLPIFRIPLRRTDPDAVLDLQQLVDQAYHFGAYYRTLRYDREPFPPLSPADAAWADQLLKAAGKR